MTFPWHHDAWTFIEKALESNRLPHALLITGKKGVGKHLFAQSLSQVLLCQNRQGIAPCGNCNACRLIKNNTHPNISLLAPEEDKKTIAIDALRETLKNTYETPYLKGKQIVIIEAEGLTPTTTNALLKTLEEPSAQVIFLLIHRNETLLLPTLKSRCQKICLNPTDPLIALTWLSAQGIDNAGTLLSLADDAPLLAQQFAADPDFLKQHANFYKALEDFYHTQHLFRFVENILALPEEWISHWFKQYFYACLVTPAQAGVQGPFGEVSYSKHFEKYTQRFTPEKCFALLDRLNTLSSDFQRVSALNKTLQWESFAIALKNC
jgi:DNA polymerase III delta' subunit